MRVNRIFVITLLLLVLVNSIGVAVYASPQYPIYDPVNTSLYPYKVVFRGSGVSTYGHDTKIQVVYSKMPIGLYYTGGLYYLRTRAVDYTSPLYKQGETRRYFVETTNPTTWQYPDLTLNGYVETKQYSLNYYTDIGEGARILLGSDILYTNTDLYMADSGGQLNGTLFKNATPIDEILNAEEYLNIERPSYDGWTTVDKIIAYQIVARVKTTQSPETAVTNYDGVSLNDDTTIESYEVYEQNMWTEGDYKKVQYSILVKYKPSTIGVVGIQAKVTNLDNNKYLLNKRYINLKAFTDSDADGFDDDTNEDIWKPYEPSTPSDSGVWITNALDDVNNWLSGSQLWISNLTRFFGTIFSFLPGEVTGGIITLITIYIVFTIIKVVRG